MSDPSPVETVAPEFTPAVVVRKPAAAASLEILDGDELIQLSIKPSLWYIAGVSVKWVVAMALLAAALALGGGVAWNPATQIAFNAVIAAAVLRAAIGSLQWASRLYVLTNRRVLRFSGVFNVRVVECRLARVQAADLRITPPQRVLGLGTIRFAAADDGREILWDQLAHPREVHEIAVRAIRKAQLGD